ncbi:catalase T [Lachancea thermotolerans CBS 6340]|uniref:Catalase n=1 Tax=Lachancea thermotolerans (strain ATCC 56472 / CBS 6340 / NRRL Y-8284) TaxID=559295 RepID=C5DLD8_LACTC|nr:KLTH0F12210p [Lachancea thermotolerans CBS 6340]CAR24289.1 KLTH0F12210p [Lachancea thermotolerans CBS 6340]
MIEKKDSTGQQVYALANGIPYSHHPYGSQVSRPDGPILLQDVHLIESIAHFDRERVPERVVHAKGGGCRLEFELTDSLSDITFAAPYQKPGYKCPGVVRFSTVGGESGTPDTARDPRGFSVKFYTEWGNHDWVFNNTPVFFIRDANKFPHFIHTQKRDPRSHLNHGNDSTMYWDYLTQNLESIHQITYMFGDRGTPADWAQMSGYSGHTFKFFNEKGELTYVQIHVRPDEGFKTLTDQQAAELSGANPDYNTRKLFDRLESGERPTYTCYVQTMTPAQAENFRYSINDLTKIWPHKEFPLRKFGKITLTENVDNYFEEIEQIAFSPSNTCVPGIEPSNDNVLQSRLFSYPDTQRHRLGANYTQLPVNSPRNMCPSAPGSSGCPFLMGNFQRDGPGCIYNQNSYPNYISTHYKERVQFKNLLSDKRSHSKYTGVVLDETSKAAVQQQEDYKKHNEIVDGKINEYQWVTGCSPLDLEQPRALYEKVYDAGAKKRFIENVVGHATKISDDIVKSRVPQYFGLLNQDLGSAIAKGLGIKYEPVSFEEYAHQSASLASAF